MKNENNDDRFIDRGSLVEECQNAVLVIAFLGQLFNRYCNIYPAFVGGSIEHAFKSAFGSRVFKKPRPLLIYIDRSKNTLINGLDMFCSEIFAEFLGENYIFWSCDITNENNKTTLIKYWKDIFSTEDSINFSMEEYPLLIGIMRQPSSTDDPFLEPSYKYEIFLSGHNLVRTSESLNLDNLLCQLINFQKEFDTIEENYPFDFVLKTRLNKDIILEIAEYLSLNDAIATFSIAVVPLLRKLKRKLPIIEPSVEFMKKIISKINSEQFIALCVKANHFDRTMKLASTNTFTNVQALTLEKLPEKIGNYNIGRYLPKATNLSVHSDEDIRFHRMCKIFRLIPNLIKQLEIRCASILCSHRRLDYLYHIVPPNETVESFVLYIDHTPWSLLNTCAQTLRKCVLRTITDFIRIMPEIQNVRIIVNQGNMKTLLGVNEWTQLAMNCRKLKKITLKVMRNMSQDIQLAQKIEEIENGLHGIRSSIEFKVKVN